MATRYNINDFALANPAYPGATVSFWTVSGGAKTATLATLYAASTGTTTLTNPRTLDSDGKFSVPVYIEVPTIATISGLTIADHDTGIMGLAEAAAATSAAAAAVSAAAALVSENNAETAETNAVAAAATIGHRKAASVAGTVDAITAVFSPVFASLAASAGIVLAIPLAGANATTTPTLAIDGLTAKTIKKDSGSALVADDIPGADFVGLFVYDASADCFQMLNPASANNVQSNKTKTLTAGYSATPYDAGTKSSGTFTPDEANGNMQRYINGGAHTLAPPTNNCTLIVQITNNGSAGAITTSGFTKVTGAAPGTTNGDDFIGYITKINGFSHLSWQALQ